MVSVVRLFDTGPQTYASRSYSLGFTLVTEFMSGTTSGAARAACGVIVKRRRPLVQTIVTGKSEIGCRHLIYIKVIDRMSN